LIKYIGLAGKPTTLFGKIPVAEFNQYKIKIIKSPKRYIKFGIAFSTYVEHRELKNLTNYILYWAENGNIEEGPNKIVKS
jgi:hypothetical protein